MPAHACLSYSELCALITPVWRPQCKSMHGVLAHTSVCSAPHPLASPHTLRPRTSPFRGENTGSIPVRNKPPISFGFFLAEVGSRTLRRGSTAESLGSHFFFSPSTAAALLLLMLDRECAVEGSIHHLICQMLRAATSRWARYTGRTRPQTHTHIHTHTHARTYAHAQCPRLCSRLQGLAHTDLSGVCLCGSVCWS